MPGTMKNRPEVTSCRIGILPAREPSPAVTRTTLNKTVRLALIAVILAAARPALAAPPGPDQSGREDFLIGTSVLALGYWGLAVPTMLELEDGTGFAAGYLLAAGAGITIPILATSGSRLTEGIAAFSLAGGIRGNADGLLIHMLFSGEDPFDRNRPTRLACMLGTSLVELYAFYHIADAGDFSVGKSKLLSVISSFGIAYGGMLSGIIDESFPTRPTAAAMLGGGMLGYLAALTLFDTKAYAPGDPDVLFWSGLIGIAIAPSIYTAAQAIDKLSTTAEVCLSLSGSLLGLVAGNLFLDGRDFSAKQGNLVNLASLGGCLLGVGTIKTLGSDDSSFDERWLPLFMTVGGLTGFLLSCALLPDGQVAKDAPGAFRFSIDPGAIVLGVQEKRLSPSGESPLPAAVTAGWQF